MRLTVSEIEEIDKKNIEISKDIEYEYNDPNVEMTCLTCGSTVTGSMSCSFEGHNCICNMCVHGLSKIKHLAIDEGHFIVKFVHTPKNIWEVIPLENFEKF